MRWSQSFIPTLRDDPADAEATSHKLMVRAGLVRQLGAGIYSYLPLGLRALKKAEAVVREEMEEIGAQEFLLPALHPAELWKESGRWDAIDATMFRLVDRKQAELCLGMTHEEIFTSVARDGIRSYRDLPQIWYQVQTKFRDEARPKSGVLRGRQFIMKDSYSFDVDAAGLDKAFDAHAAAYARIFERCGVFAVPVEASSGAMGGSESTEFMALSDAGEDWIVSCAACGYSANLEKAQSVPTPADSPSTGAVPEKFATPGIRSIEALTTFEGGAAAADQLKTLVYSVAGELVLFCLRGDHELNEVKVMEVTGRSDVHPAHAEEIKQALGALPGSLGAVGVEGQPVYLDFALRGRQGMTTGANEDDFHLRHVDVERDLAHGEWADLRNVEVEDRCISCGEAIEVRKAIEVGHIFKLGLRYSESMGARVLNAEGKEIPITMGSYGIGVDRIVAAAIEENHDENGIIWPVEIAPFQVVVSPLKVKDAEQLAKAEQIYEELSEAGFDALLDDRDERPGVKFKDADLIGIPFRIVPGPRALAKGNVEFVERATGEMQEIPFASIVEELEKRA